MWGQPPSAVPRSETEVYPLRVVSWNHQIASESLILGGPFKPDFGLSGLVAIKPHLNLRFWVAHSSLILA